MRFCPKPFWAKNIGEVQQSVLFLYKDEYVYFTQDKKGQMHFKIAFSKILDFVAWRKTRSEALASLAAARYKY